MEPIEGNNEDVLKQHQPSFSNSLDYQSSFSNPFEALFQSSSDNEMENELSSILRIDADYSNRLSREEVSRVFNRELFNVEPQIIFRNEMIDSETLSTELNNCIEFMRKSLGNGVFDLGPIVATCVKHNELKELDTLKELRAPFASPSYRLSHIYLWMFRYDSDKDYEKIKDLQLKAMSPLMFAALTSKPNIVYFLLKYGARFFDETHGLIADAGAIPMRILCMRLLLSNVITELFDTKVWDFDALKLKTDFSNLPEGLRLKCLNFRLLLRCDSNPYVTSVKLARLNDPQLPPLPEMNILRHVYDSLFPDLGLGLYNAPKLQNMARCVIRRRLHDNWQLPDGISQLEFPKILCDYINLLDD